MESALREKLYIRADADARIGAGHVMRCLALAQGWMRGGGQAVFLTLCASNPLIGRIEETGAGIVALTGIFPEPADLRETLGILNADRGLRPWLVLDGYNFDCEYQEAVRSTGARLLVIDDTAHRPRYSADILLNQNLGAGALEYATEGDTLVLRACEYALLRAEFLAWRQENPLPNRSGHNVLVTLGGADPDNGTLKVIEALLAIELTDLRAKVIVGPANPHRNTLERALATCPTDIALVRCASDMPGLMDWADVAVSAAGGTCLELAFMGLPALLVITAPNQRGVAAGMDREGAAVSLGELQSLNINELSTAISGLLGNTQLRSQMLDRGQRLVDGRGVDRVMAAMRDMSE